jgi:general secretion pathway protein H
MTLIEVIVVLLLISLTTALVTGTIRSGPRADTEVDRLALVLEMAAEQARVRGTPIRFESLRHGYRFRRLDTDGNWQVITDEATFGERNLPPDVVLNHVLRDGQEVSKGLDFGSDVVLYTVEGIVPGGPFSLAGEATGAVKKVMPMVGAS